MQTVSAMVCAVNGNTVQIEVSSTGCGRCSEPGGCGGANVSRALCGAPKRFWVTNSLGVVPGDHVLVGIESSKVRQVATSVYVIPLMCMLGGAIVGSLFGSLVSVLGGVIGIALGWYRLIYYKKMDLLVPQMIGVRSEKKCDA